MLKSATPRMIDALQHRGPDCGGVWFDDTVGIALAHRRLSILDLSAAGHQPMESSCGRYVMVFNGEIYNHLELRKELERLSSTGGLGAGSGPHAIAWRGHSDTETVLAAFARWGVRKTLEQCVGMFALALWDRQTRTLTLVRDRLGEKPLYYGWQSGAFLFGSELKALKANPAFQAEIDRGALTLLLRHNYIPAPYSIYQGIRKLWPGTYLQLALDSEHYRSQILPEPQPYWSVQHAVELGQGELMNGGDADAVDRLDRLLRDAVRQQMVADVPLGAFLSGGIDSSTIVALMQAQSVRSVKTFTIGFHEMDYNEAEHAKAVARHLGTEHTELYVTPQEALEVIPRLPLLYDEPFSDSSQIPTFLVSRMTRRHVTVSLSGDAGDELFGGYNRYLLADSISRLLAVFPRAVRRGAARGIMTASPAMWSRAYEWIAPLLPAKVRFTQAGDKAHKLATVLGAASDEKIYHRLISHWENPAEVVIGTSEPPTLLTSPETWPAVDSLEHRMMALDTMSYLPDDILAKLDRAAMGASLETRVPMLDHRVVEFAWRLPLSMKIRNGQGKWILRQVLYKYVPRDLMERPKMGFGVPIDSWLRGPLRDWAEMLLDESRLRREGYLHPGPIRKKWSEHLSGRHNWQYQLWDVLMFQAWLEQEHAGNP